MVPGYCGHVSPINLCTLRIESADRVRGIIEGGKQYAPTDINQARQDTMAASGWACEDIDLFAITAAESVMSSG